MNDSGASEFEPGVPHHIRVERVAYALASDVAAPPNTVPLGTDSEGRALYGDPARRSSRKHVFLAARTGGLVGYARPDPPSGYGLTDVLGAAFPKPLPRPEALALLGLLNARQVVLGDGTRLGGPRDALARAVASVALEPTGFATQAGRVPEWALAEALRLRQATLSDRILTVEWVRSLVSPELGFVRTITPTELVLGRRSREPADVGEAIVVRSQDNSHGDILTRVVDLDERDVRVVLDGDDRAEGVGHGDPAYFVAVARRPGSDVR